MLPLGMLTAAQGQGILVELKSGETVNGTLLSNDTFMNLILIKVVLTGKDGDTFFQMEEFYVRGSSIKFMRLPEKVVQAAKDQQQARGQGDHRGGRGGMGSRGDHHRGGGDRGGMRGMRGRGRG
ncbi:Sm-like ribonucleo protein, partial [Amniculicola lignicola CBS 123094]